MRKESVYGEVRIDFYDDVDKTWTVDAWYTDDPNEDGQVVAKVNPLTKEVEYLEPIAEDDPYVQDVINSFVKEFVPNFEYIARVPSEDAVVYLQEGSGENLLSEDRAEGYDAYIDYSILDGKHAGDGGAFMYKSEEHPEWESWTDAIPDALAFALDVTQEQIAEYELEEVDEEELEHYDV